MSDFKFFRPRDMNELLEFKQKEGSRALILAGGSNLLVYIKEGSIKEGTLVDIRSLEALKGITGRGTTIEIGAGETIADILESSLLNEKIPFFRVVRNLPN